MVDSEFGAKGDVFMAEAEKKMKGTPASLPHSSDLVV
jgi:hypothetical protein